MRHLEFEMHLRSSRSAAFDLLSDVAVLDRVTPRWFRLIPVGEVPRDLSVGSTVDYHLRWRGVPMRWRSVIRCWDRPSVITYEQAAGPFRVFRHEHLFFEQDDGVRVVDRVCFEAVGRWPVEQWLVEPDLRHIFAHRRQALQTLSGAVI